jgi:hypothetical protein
MRKLFTLIFVAVTLQSCLESKVPIKGSYTNPNTFYFEKTEDEVWKGLMAVICDKGLSIKSMDKFSGVIFGDKYDFGLNASAEHAKDKLVNKEAFIVTEYVVYNGSTYILPSSITADWNIRIFQYEGKTALKINVKNIVSKYPSGQSFIYYDAKSTGNFEKLIADSIVF